MDFTAFQTMLNEPGVAGVGVGGWDEVGSSVLRRTAVSPLSCRNPCPQDSWKGRVAQFFCRPVN